MMSIKDPFRNSYAQTSMKEVWNRDFVEGAERCRLVTYIPSVLGIRAEEKTFYITLLPAKLLRCTGPIPLKRLSLKLSSKRPRKRRRHVPLLLSTLWAVLPSNLVDASFL